MKKAAVLASLIPLTAFAACTRGTGADYEPAIDTPRTAAYQQDLSECQTIAQTRKYDGAPVENAAGGAVVGGVIGAFEEGAEGAAIGAAIGAVGVGGAGLYATREQRKNIVINCMAGRGYNIIG